MERDWITGSQRREKTRVQQAEGEICYINLVNSLNHPHTWSGLVSVPELFCHSYQHSQSRTAEHWGVSYLSEPQHGCHLVTGTCFTNPNYRARRWLPCGEQGVPTHTTCYVNLLIFLLCDTEHQWKEQGLAQSSFVRAMKDRSCACCSRLSITQNDEDWCYLWFKSPTSC